jgi:flagellar assembly factor FliW
MKINTRYHGTREYNDKDVITFKRGIPGFEDLKQFIIFPLDDNDFFNILHSIEDEAIGLVTVSPFSIYPNYEINLEDNILSDLNITEEKDVLILTTVTLNSKIENITVNLKAPIVINIVERLGEQVILDKIEYSIKHPLLQES